MQNPDEDTEWNDVLRSKGILPPKPKEISEEQVIDILEQTVKEKTGQASRDLDKCDLDGLDELEDEEDERVLLAYRQKRIEEMRAASMKARFGDVREISAIDYVQEVNKAGEGIWVLLHLYKQGIPLCALINQHLVQLARKFPGTKFLKSISTTCVPNFPDKNLPTIFAYYEGDMKHQWVGPIEFGGMRLTLDELEWKLHKAGAVKSSLSHDPAEDRPKVDDVMMKGIRQTREAQATNSDDDDDW